MESARGFSLGGTIIFFRPTPDPRDGVESVEILVELAEAEPELLSSVASTAGCDVTLVACEFSSAGGGVGIRSSVGFRAGSNVGDCDAGAVAGPPAGCGTVSGCGG